MKRGDKKICTNCQIHQKEEKKNQKEQKEQKDLIEQKNKNKKSENYTNQLLEEILNPSDNQSMSSRKTLKELNTAEIKLPNFQNALHKKKFLEKIFEETNPDNNNKETNKNVFSRSSINKPINFEQIKPQINPFSQSLMPQKKFSLNSNILRTSSNPRNPQNSRFSILSTNSNSESLVKEIIINDEKSLNLMSEINQTYLEQIKITISEIRNSNELSNIEKFKMMKEIMEEYKTLVKSDN